MPQLAAIGSNWQQLAAIGSTVSVWDVGTQVLAFELVEHSDGVKSIAFRNDGKIIATGESYDGIKLWDEEGRNICHLDQSNAFVDVAFLPNGKLMSCGMVSSTISMWDAQSHELVETWKSPIPELTGLNCGEDGMFVSSHGVGSHQLTVWHCNDRSPLGTITPDGVPFGEIKAIKFGANSKRLFVGGGTLDSGLVTAIDAESGTTLSRLEIHNGIVNDVAASSDGNWLATCSDDKSIKLLDGTSLSELKTLVGHSAAVMTVAFSENADHLISAGGYDGTVRIWDHRTGTELRRLDFEPHSFVLSARFARGGKTVLVARTSQDAGIIEAINLDNGEQLYVIETPTLTSLVASPCDNFDGYCDGNFVTVFDVATGNELARLKAATNSAAFSQSGSRLLITERDIHCFDTQTYKKVAAFECTNGRPERVAVGADGKHFAAALRNGIVTIWTADR